jgi:hypothetical protein
MLTNRGYGDKTLIEPIINTSGIFLLSLLLLLVGYCLGARTEFEKKKGEKP